MFARQSDFLPLFQSRILNHIGFWILMVLLLAYHGSLFRGNFGDNLINSMCLLPAQIAAAYMMIYYQAPKWLFKGAWIKFGIYSLLIAYSLAVVARLSIIYVAEPLMGIDDLALNETLGEIVRDPAYLIKVYVGVVYLPALLLFLLKMTKEKFTQENRLLTLEKEKSLAELSFLKAQMNPHFLFNTLNSMYAMAKSESDQTPEMILKLSEILHYTIYECSNNRVPISKEWELIENYTDLQVIRFKERLMLVLDKQIDDPQLSIAPLMLITFVENACKYALSDSEDPPQIKISLLVERSTVIFEVFNTTSPNKSKVNQEKRSVGLQNVRRQLEILYPGCHTLTVEEKHESYQVILNIQVN